MLFLDVECAHRTKAEDFLKGTGLATYNIMEFGTLSVILDGVSAGLGVSGFHDHRLPGQKIMVQSIPTAYLKSTESYRYGFCIDIIQFTQEP